MAVFKKSTNERTPFHPRPEPIYPGPVTAERLKGLFADCSDLESRTLSVPGALPEADVLWLDGLCSTESVGADVIRPLTQEGRFQGVRTGAEAAELMLRGGVWSSSASDCPTLDAAVSRLTAGHTAVIFRGSGRAVCFETKASNTRSVTEPSSEKSVKGAKDAFVETLRTNTALLRRKLRLPELKLRRSVLGRKSRTEAALVWIEGVASPELVEAVGERLGQIDEECLLSPEELESYLAARPRCPFPQTLHTERPDRMAMALLDGRVGIIVDGLPMGFMAPAGLAGCMKVPEDRAQHYIIASLLSVLRYFAAVISVLLPAFLVAAAMYHQEMIPTKLLQSMIAAKQEVPFGVALEVVSMLVAFELLQEAGLRLPSSVGQTISIVGALIVGQSAVEAKVISPIAVIVVAVAGIAGYTIPNQDLAVALRICRLLTVLAAAFSGLFGLMAAIVALVLYLCSIDSFGVSYMAPFCDRESPGVFGAILRRPLWRDKYRPEELCRQDRRKRK